MKPKKLRLKNFGPFIDETIDFSKLTEAPLFLITGKTGAGKTTLFDGMTYALFGETSGRLRTGKEMRSLFATPEEETNVFFSFEHQRISYEIERKPEQILAKRKGEGTRKQTAKVSLTIFDEKGKEMRQFTKRSEVDQLIKELMNLDAKQFSQIVLLPQGEFRNFLISSSNEKEIVLRNLFGTHYFQQLNEQLKEKAKQYQKQMDHLEQELMMLQKRFIPISEELSLENENFEAILTKWQEEQEKLQVNILQEKSVLSDWHKQQKQLEDTYYHSQTLQARHEEKKRLDKKKEELLQQEKTINDLRHWLTHYEFAEKLIDLLTRKQECQSEQNEWQAKEKDCLKELSSQKQAYEEWKKQEPQRLTVQQEMEQLVNTLQEMKQLIPIAEEWQNKQITNSALRLEKKNAEEQKQHIVQEKLQIQEEQKKLQERLNDQEQLHEDQLCYEKLHQEQEKHQETVGQFQQMTKELQLNQQRLVEINEQHQINQTLLVEQMKQVDVLKSQWASQQIARLQLLLLPGEPCPVCGALEHPKKQTTHQLLEKEQIMQIEGALAEAEAKLEQLNQTIGRNEAEKAQVQQKISELSQSIVDEQIKLKRSNERLKSALEHSFQITKADEPMLSLKKIRQDLDMRAERIAQAKVSYQHITEHLTVVDDKLKFVEDQLAQNEEKLLKGQGEIDSLSKQLENKDIQTLVDDTKQLEERVFVKTKWLAEEKEKAMAFSQEIKLLQAQYENIGDQQTKNTQKLHLLQEKISQKLQEQSYFKQEDEVLSFARQTKEYKQHRQTIASYDEERLIAEDRLSQLANVSLEERLPDLNKLKQELTEVKSKLAKQQENCYRLCEQERNNQKIIEEFSAIYQASQEQLDELIQLQQLSQTINGENPRKTSLERYVLQVYLQEVLQVANSQLQRLTRNRYQFELAEEIGSYRGKTGLEINVYDDEAGLTRGAHTLSGGESFIAALSLALALAEVIQAQTGGVSIEALFIDEGFGSLDEEALEMAIEALETIESEGRMIGIISHVRELKERVVQQIRIETEGSGQSKVRYHLG